MEDRLLPSFDILLTYYNYSLSEPAASGSHNKHSHKRKIMFHSYSFRMENTTSFNKECYIHQISYKTLKIRQFITQFTTILVT